MTVLTSTVINNAEIKDKIYYIWDDMVKGFALKKKRRSALVYFWRYSKFKLQRSERRSSYPNIL